jgi:hypothetical protein
MLCFSAYIQLLKGVVCVEGRGRAERVSVNRLLAQPYEYGNTGGLRCYRVCALRHTGAQ